MASWGLPINESKRKASQQFFYRHAAWQRGPRFPSNSRAISEAWEIFFDTSFVHTSRDVSLLNAEDITFLVYLLMYAHQFDLQFHGRNSRDSPCFRRKLEKYSVYYVYPVVAIWTKTINIDALKIRAISHILPHIFLCITVIVFVCILFFLFVAESFPWVYRLMMSRQASHSSLSLKRYDSKLCRRQVVYVNSWINRYELISFP